MGLFSRSHSKGSVRGASDHCGGCKWWQGQAEGTSDRVSLGLCMHAELIHFNLEVSADSGCNRFEPAMAAAGAEIEAIPSLMPGMA